MSKSFDPYYKWLGIPPEEQPPHHYRLLGIRAFESDADVIEGAADRQSTHLRGAQSGKHAALSQQLLNEVAQARLVLLNPTRKQVYDQNLRQALGEQPVRPAPAVAPNITTQSPAKGSAARPPWQQPLVLGAAAVAVLLVVGLSAAIVTWAFARSSEPGQSNSLAKAGSDQDQAARKADSTKSKPHQATDRIPSPVDPSPSPDPANDATTPSASEPMEDEPGESPLTTSPAEPGSKEPPVAANPPTIVEQPTVVEQPTIVESPDAAGKVGSQPPTADPPAARPTPDPPQRLALPSDEAQAPVRITVEQAFQLSEAKTSAQQLAAVKELSEAAGKTTGNPAERFVLLRAAMELSAKGGDAERMLMLIEKIGEEYAIEVPQVLQSMLVRFANEANSKAAFESLLAGVEVYYEQAIAGDEYDAAMEVATAVYNASQGGVGREFRKAAYDRRKEIAGLQVAWQEIADVRATLESNPDDPAANLALGRWYCLDRDDWQTGLPYLAKGGDAELAELANREAAAPESADEQVALGDAWYDLAQRTSSELQRPLLLRAAHWYRTAQPNLTSPVVQLKVERLLEKIGAPAPQVAEAGPAPAKETAQTLIEQLLAISPPATKREAKELRPGLVVLPFAQDASQVADNNFFLDPKKFETVVGRPWITPTVDSITYPKELNIIAYGFLKIPVAGDYEFQSSNFYTRHILYLDGKVLSKFRHPDIDRVTLEAGYVPIVAVSYAGARGTLKLQWKPPGEVLMSPVPPAALCHLPEK